MIAARAVVALVVVVVAACGDGKPVAHVREARTNADGSAVLVVLERGTERIEGNLFSGHGVVTTESFELHRLDLGSGRMTRVTARAAASAPVDGPATVAGLTSEPLGGPLRSCDHIHSECVARTVPAPFVVRRPDRFDVAIVAPVAGVRVAWDGTAFASTPFTIRTADAARADADAAMRRTVAALETTARAELDALRARDAPELRDAGGDRGVPALGTWNDGTRAFYRFVPVGAILARVSPGNEAVARIAWLPGDPCMTDSALVARAVPDCRYREERSFDAALAAFERRAP